MTLETVRVIVLGGGLGGISAAWELSHAEATKYDITVYQMGWRLGGKGASGRNSAPGMASRIEEHGVHVWSGLYDNAFRMIRQVYDEAGRAPDAPLGTWRDAFVPSDNIALQERWRGAWLPWSVPLPVNDELPGEPDARLFVDASDYIGEALQLAGRLVSSARQPASEDGVATLPKHGVLGTLLVALERDVTDVVFWLARVVLMLLPACFERWVLRVLAWVMRDIWRRVRPRIDEVSVRRFWISLNFLYGNLAGAIAERITRIGVDALDEYDYLEWLGKYVVDDTVEGQPLTLSSPWALFLYDAEFAYDDGDMARPNFGAGSALRTLIRMVLTWKGALIWKMQAGMGDAVFAPMYEVLARRGVKFRFFHRVTSIHPDELGTSVSRVEIDVQAELAPGRAEYQPLVDVNGVACWPSQADWSQLAGGQALREKNFESYCEGAARRLVLSAGTDFDSIVCAIPVGALPYVAGELVRVNPRWKAMVDRVRTVRTQAMQLWLGVTSYQLGWELMGRPLLACFHASALNTWADMTHLTIREGWPSGTGDYPLSVHYFCGPMRDDPFNFGPNGPMQDCEYLDQRRADELAKDAGRDLLQRSIGYLWPQSTTSPSDANSGLDWSLLVDDRPQPGAGIGRLDAQYFRGNVAPSERFTMTAKGSLSARLYPDESGFANLVLAGDWTRNDFNIGNVEATVMSGMLAANAISGHPQRSSIVGLGFLSLRGR